MSKIDYDINVNTTFLFFSKNEALHLLQNKILLNYIMK